MMKMNKKYSIVAVALIALLCVGAASALITIWSDPVHFDLRYTVTMSATFTEYRIGEGMALVARVLNSSSGGVSGITVHFYASADGGAYFEVGSGISNNFGDASFLWTGAGAHDYLFKAYCEI
jgi:hypothetical protein